MNNYDVLRPNDNFRGRTYGEWASEWWKWIVCEDPDSYFPEDPMLFLRSEYDYESAKGDRRQKNKHYDRTGGKRIEILESTAIFFPVIEAEFNEGDPYPEDGSKMIKTEKEMRYLARRDIDEGGPMGATIKNGQDHPTPIVDDLKDYRAESPLFRLAVSPKNQIKDKMEVVLRPDTYDAVTDGYWILIKSLSSSEQPYQIHFEAIGRGAVSYSSTYDIVVKSSMAAGSVTDKSRELLTGNSLHSKEG
jgi:hypothetical protein